MGSNFFRKKTLPLDPQVTLRWTPRDPHAGSLSPPPHPKMTARSMFTSEYDFITWVVTWERYLKKTVVKVPCTTCAVPCVHLHCINKGCPASYWAIWSNSMEQFFVIHASWNHTCSKQKNNERQLLPPRNRQVRSV